MTQYDAYYEGYGLQVEPRHSGLGVASFTISLITGVLLMVAIVIAGMMAVADPESIEGETPAAVGLGCTIMLGMVVNLVGIGLGIAGMVQSSRKRVFAVLGTIFNAGLVLGVCFLIVVGTVAG